MVVLTSSDPHQFDSPILSLLTSVVAPLEGTILPIGLIDASLADIFHLSHVYFASDFDWSAELGVFMVSAIAALQPTIGSRS